MRLRSRERNRGGILDIPKKIIIKITSKSIPVRNEPSRLGLIVCQLQKDYIVKVNEECEVDEIKWLKINSGWICSRDSNGSLCYSLSHEVEANKFWASENVNRRRVASAISQLLAKGHSLTNARRVSSLLFKQSSLYVKNLKPLTNLPDVSIEDLVIALTTSSGLKATEIFEFMKVAASQQSDPPKALLDMATQINDTMNLRPSLWVKNDLGVLDTVDVVMKNDIFVMACARNDLKKFDECLAKGQELAAIHSELKYTGLHAAADFGAKDIVERLLLAGISPNVRDARHGRTALHFAAQSGRCEIAILLLEKGADRSLADFSGSLSCEIADDQGHAECREILKQIPPEIQYAQVTHCTDKSITIQWIPPVIISHIHAKVDEFMVIHEPIDKKYGAGQSYSTKQVYLTVSDLAPSTGHGFVVMSHSVSGWSQPSAKLIHFTLPAAPTAPSIIELIKVTKNGLLITWQPPDNENGGPVDLYHIEMTDKDMICNDYSVTDSNVNSSRSLQNDNDDSDNSDNDSSTNTNTNTNTNDIKRKLSTTSLTSQLSEDTIGTELHMNNGKMLPKTLADDIPGTINNLLDGKWHRLIKHRDVSHRSKYVMGLETYRNYYFRCTCRNEFGWSPWSNWSGPYTPQEGVQVRQFGDNWIRIGWIEPQLAKNRQVDCYEVQMSTPTGPMSTSIALYKSKSTQKSLKSLKSSKSNKKNTNQPEFKTIDSNCIKAEVIAKNLKAGKKYQFRVRPKINGEWVEWDLCVLSDVITMPSSAPDAPQNLHVIRIKNHSVILTNRSSKIDISLNTNKINDQNNSLATISLLTTPTKVTSTTGTSLITSNSNYTYNSNNSYNTYDNSYNNNNNKESSKKTMVRSSKEIQPKINQDKQFHPTTSFSKITVNHATRPSRLVQSNNHDDDSFESRSDNDDNDNGGDDDNDNNGDDDDNDNDNDDEDNESDSNSYDNNNDDHNDNEDNSQSDNSNSDDEQDNEKLNMSTRGTLPPFDDDNNEQENNNDDNEIELQITHNSIDLEWKNGTPNGSAILGCEVQCCKVKEYCIDDLEKASKAAGKEEAWDDEITGLNKIDALNWVNITEKGIFLSGQSFRALGLTSGVGYIFRVRQRNDVHWSSFSRATSIITTLLSAPPCQPEVIMTSSSHIVIQWTIQTNTTFIFSGLESNIQIAKLDLTVPLNQPVPSSLIKDLVWERAEYRSCNKNINDGDDDNNQNKIHSVERMIIDNLLPMTCYTVRVRIRTVAGWTSWSELSYPFRTLALP